MVDANMIAAMDFLNNFFSFDLQPSCGLDNSGRGTNNLSCVCHMADGLNLSSARLGSSYNRNQHLT